MAMPTTPMVRVLIRRSSVAPSASFNHEYTQMNTNVLCSVSCPSAVNSENSADDSGPYSRRYNAESLNRIRRARTARCSGACAKDREHQAFDIKLRVGMPVMSWKPNG
jgi:hypothetical protein